MINFEELKVSGYAYQLARLEDETIKGISRVLDRTDYDLDEKVSIIKEKVEILEAISKQIKLNRPKK